MEAGGGTFGLQSSDRMVWQSAFILHPKVLVQKSPQRDTFIAVSSEEIPRVLRALCEEQWLRTKYTFLIINHKSHMAKSGLRRWIQILVPRYRECYI